MSKFSGLKKGDIVRIKFKEIKNIANQKNINSKTKRHHRLINEWELGSNIVAFTYGGDFLVKEDAPPSSKDQVLDLVNHLDGGTFEIPEQIVESLEIVDSAYKFISEDHGLAIIMTDTDLFVNGVKLENDSENNHLDNFVSFIERYLTNSIVNKSLKETK